MTRITTKLNRASGTYTVQANGSVAIGTVRRASDGTWTAYVGGDISRGHKTLRAAVAEVRRRAS